MYRLTVDGVETYMVVTRNVFSHRLTVHRKYDLKGSTVAREASDKEKVCGRVACLVTPSVVHMSCPLCDPQPSSQTVCYHEMSCVIKHLPALGILSTDFCLC